MAEFHETWYGARFFDFQLPELTSALEKLAVAVLKISDTELNKEESQRRLSKEADVE